MATGDAPVEIRLELDPESDPISGLLHDARGDAYRFRTWMQLMAAVDKARSARGRPDDPEAPRQEANRPLR